MKRAATDAQLFGGLRDVSASFFKGLQHQAVFRFVQIETAASHWDEAG
jgi:hypothetical protein